MSESLESSLRRIQIRKLSLAQVVKNRMLPKVRLSIFRKKCPNEPIEKYTVQDLQAFHYQIAGHIRLKYYSRAKSSEGYFEGQRTKKMRFFLCAFPYSCCRNVQRKVIMRYWRILIFGIIGIIRFQKKNLRKFLKSKSFKRKSLAMLNQESVATPAKRITHQMSQESLIKVVEEKKSLQQQMSFVQQLIKQKGKQQYVKQPFIIRKTEYYQEYKQTIKRLDQFVQLKSRCNSQPEEIFKISEAYRENQKSRSRLLTMENCRLTQRKRSEPGTGVCYSKENRRLKAICQTSR